MVRKQFLLHNNYHIQENEVEDKVTVYLNEPDGGGPGSVLPPSRLRQEQL